MAKMPKTIANSWLTEPRVDDQNTVGETLTQAEFADDCDINVQIKRFQSVGVSPFRLFDESQVADLSELSADLITAHNTIEAAREQFDELPDNIKQRFSGSPKLFLDFIADIHNNVDEARQLGLFDPKSPSAQSHGSEKARLAEPSSPALPGVVPPDGGTPG